jgi:multidrug efflux pump
MVISAINAMTLTPSRAVAIFESSGVDEHGHPRREALPWWIFIALGAWLSYWIATKFFAGALGLNGEHATLSWPMFAAVLVPGAVAGGLFGWMFITPINAALARFFKGFNRVFDRFAGLYGAGVSRLVRGSALVLLVYVGLLFVTSWVFQRAPQSFIPVQDQGYLLVNVQLPDAASVQRTSEVIDKIVEIALGDPNDPEHEGGVPGIAHTLSIAGQSFLLGANGSNFGSAYLVLDPFHQRGTPETYDAAIAVALNKRFAEEIDDAVVQIFRAPPIMGLGSGGFRLQVLQKGYQDFTLLQQSTDELIGAGMESNMLFNAFTMFRADTPQIYLDVDRVKCESLGIPVSDVFNTLQVYMGGYFVNLFNAFGRTWQVNVLAEPEFRTTADALKQLKIRNNQGEMAPLGTLFNAQAKGGPAIVMRYNTYPTAPIIGNPKMTTSSGQVIQLFDQLGADKGVDFNWTEIMYLQLLAGNAALGIFAIGTALIFLVLAAKYESWKLPLAVILVVPMCLLCAVVGMLIARLPVDIFVQIGFLVLVGLAAKNAILIVEFAQQLLNEGKSLHDATVEAATLRLRPIVMTSFAFILGVVPLMLGTGAGAEMRRSLGTAVFSGMIGVTIFGVLLTPVFFYALVWLRRKPAKDAVGRASAPANAASE